MPRYIKPEEARRRIFVGRLDTATEDRALNKHFGQFGDLTDSVVMRYPDSMKSRGFGFVTFSDDEGMRACMAYGGPHRVDGREVEIKRAEAREEDTRSSHRRGGGGAYLIDKDVGRRLFIGRLDYATDDATLRRHFGRYGELLDCVVMRWPDSMRSRGFGFVTFKDKEGMEACMADKPHTVDGKEIEITVAQPKEGYRGPDADGGDGDPVTVADFDPEAKQMRRLFLGRLNERTTENGLTDYFGRFGAVEEAVVLRFHDSDKSRGFGFIVFEEAAAVDACQKARPHLIDGKKIECRRATPRRDAKNPEAHMEVTKLWVGGFKEEMSDDDIKEYFGEFGEVDAVEQIRHSDTGKKRGFGFVTFKDADTVDKICLINRHILMGKLLEVKKALSKEQIASARDWDRRGRGGGGDDFDGDDYGGLPPLNSKEMSQMFAMFVQQMMGGGGRSSGGSGGRMIDAGRDRGRSRGQDDYGAGFGARSSRGFGSSSGGSYGAGSGFGGGYSSGGSYRAGGGAGGGGSSSSYGQYGADSGVMGYGAMGERRSMGPMRSGGGFSSLAREASNPYHRAMGGGGGSGGPRGGGRYGSRY